MDCRGKKSNIQKKYWKRYLVDNRNENNYAG